MLGDLLQVSFQNQLPVPSTIYWHGIRNVNAMGEVACLTQSQGPPGVGFTHTVPSRSAGNYCTMPIQWFAPR
ncbi:MAG TPA: hypothetical protein DGB85_09935 [Deltaproteobacteria bacterium]|nr:hypothetical protein [Deltaproteobacteria bacterium]